MRDIPTPRDQSTAYEGASVEISVVVPVYGSAGILPTLHARLTKVLDNLGRTYEIIFVDDCGPGDTWSVLQRLCRNDRQVVALQLMRNVGQSNSTLCGLAYSRGELVITMDDDLQHPPEEIPVLLGALADDLDVVMGIPRVKRHNRFRRFGSSAVSLISGALLQRPRHIQFSSFRLLRRSVVDAVLRMKTLSPALSLMISSLTHRIATVLVEHAARAEGTSGYTLRRLFRQFSNNVIGYSMFPLRLLAAIGAIGIAMSLLFSVSLLVRYFWLGTVMPGWTSTVLLLLLISGFNFFAFAILGEYLLRILQRVNATPQYVVRDGPKVQEN